MEKHRTTRRRSSRLLLLQITDSVFPIGAYSHSYGLETYIQKGLVKNAAEAKRYLDVNIRFNLCYSELLPMRLAYELAAGSDWEGIKKLEERMQAIRLPLEVRAASHKLAARFVKTAALMLEEDALARWQHYAGQHNAGQHNAGQPAAHMVSVAYGVFAQVSGIGLEELLTAYLYNQVSGLTVNCVKSIPLSQTAGQELLFRSEAVQMEAVETVMEAPEEMLGLSMPGFDIRCMQHETLYSRLYMS